MPCPTKYFIQLSKAFCSARYCSSPRLSKAVTCLLPQEDALLHTAPQSHYWPYITTKVCPCKLKPWKANSRDDIEKTHQFMFYTIRIFNLLISDDWARSCHSEIRHSIQTQPCHVLTQLPQRFPTHLFSSTRDLP